MHNIARLDLLGYSPQQLTESQTLTRQLDHAPARSVTPIPVSCKARTSPVAHHAAAHIENHPR